MSKIGLSIMRSGVGTAEKGTVLAYPCRAACRNNFTPEISATICPGVDGGGGCCIISIIGVIPRAMNAAKAKKTFQEVKETYMLTTFH